MEEEGFLGSLGSGLSNIGSGATNAGSGLVHGIADAGRSGSDAVGLSILQIKKFKLASSDGENVENAYI